MLLPRTEHGAWNTVSFRITAPRSYAFGEAVYPNGGVFGPVSQSYLTLFVIYSGRASVDIDGRELVLDGGTCCVVLNTRQMALRCERGQSTRVGWSESHPVMAAEVMQMELSHLPEQIQITPRIELLHKLGTDLGLTDERAVNQLRNAIGEALFSAYLLEAQTAATDRPVPRSVVRARQYAEANFADGCHLASLAEAAGTSPQYLVLAFRKHLGITPSRYVWRLRAVRGLNLLQQTDLTVAEIAYQCGYKNPYHFSRKIRQYFKRPPSELRKRRGYIDASGIAEGAPDIHY